MAERSKAPDSRLNFPAMQRLSVLVLSEGVGSNPTSDNFFFTATFCMFFLRVISFLYRYIVFVRVISCDKIHF